MPRARDARLTAATLFPSRSADLLGCWRTGRWVVEHAPVRRLASLTRIPEIQDLHRVLALGPEKISAYGVSGAGPQWRRGTESVRALQSINNLSPEQARNAYDAGLSILCGDLLPLIPELQAQIEGLLGEFGLPARGSGAARLLDVAGGEPMEAVLSFSPAGAAAALGLHYDAFEVISIQLQGTKVWMLGNNEDVRFPLFPFETETPGPNGHAQPATAPNVALDRVEMRPGSALFVPRGAWHCTQEVGPDDPSVTLLLKFIPPSFLEVLVTSLFTELSERPEWRQPCVGLFRPSRLRHESLAAFQTLVDTLDLDAARLVLDRYMPPRAAPDLLTFERIDGVTLRVDRARAGAGAVTLRLQTPDASGELAVDVALAPLCRWISSAKRRSFSFAEACAIAGDAGADTVWSLLGGLEEAGVLAAAVEDQTRA